MDWRSGVRLSKRILSSDIIQSIVCWIASLYIRLVHTTGRWRVVRGDIPATFWSEGKPFILAFWHGRLLMVPHLWKQGLTFHVLISGHRDGQLIAKTVKHLNVQSVTGSSSKGGGAALKRMLSLLKAGEYVGITPDGPRGPRMRASNGVVAIARLSGLPVVPVTYSVNRRRVMDSWDRFLLALPFCRGVFVWGEPIDIPRDADEEMQEDYRRRIENALNDLCREADQMTGLPTVEPADEESIRGEAHS